MAAICADCRTANRDGAKFCKGCGHRLRIAAPVIAVKPRSDIEEDWPATQRMSMRHELDRVEDLPPTPDSRAPSLPRPPQSDERRPHSKSFPSARAAAAHQTATHRIGAWSLAALVVAGGSWYAYN